MTIKKLHNVASQMFSKYLLVTNTCTASSLLALGDCITQQIERLDNPNKKYNFHRTGIVQQQKMTIKKLHNVASQMFSKYLLVTNTCTASSLLALGDCITQQIERLDNPNKKYNFHRTGIVQQQKMTIKKLHNVASQMFSKYLLVTNTCTASSLLALGDCITQQIERLDNPNKKYNFHRTGRMFTMGFLFGPVTHAWYKILDRYLPGTAVITVGKKILADQAVAGPFFCSAFFMGMSLLEGRSSREGMEEVKAKFWTVYLIDWCLWPPAQFINFFFLPPSFRVVYVSGITLVWNTILSWIKHKEHHTEGEIK